MSGLPPTFHLFAQLPIELQKEIWRYCLPHRVREYDSPSDTIVFDTINTDVPTPCLLHSTAKLNACPPMITRVCRESRAVAFESGTVTAIFATDRPRYNDFLCNKVFQNAWADHKRDSAHINWTAMYEAD